MTLSAGPSLGPRSCLAGLLAERLDVLLAGLVLVAIESVALLQRCLARVERRVVAGGTGILVLFLLGGTGDEQEEGDGGDGQAQGGLRSEATAYRASAWRTTRSARHSAGGGQCGSATGCRDPP